MTHTIVLEISTKAVATIEDCCKHTARLAMHYGEGSPQHVRAARSLIAVFNSILHFGGQLRWDADLCLVGLTESGITYGVVFHADHDNQERGADGPEPGTWSLHS